MAAKPDPKRRSPASRPGKAGASVRGRKPAKPSQTATHTTRSTTRTLAEHVVEPIKRSIAESVEQRSDQRLGFTARRAAVLAAVVCVLTLTIAGPVRTYFAQRTEMDQLAATEAALRHQIADLEQQKGKLERPGLYCGAGPRAPRLREARRYPVPGPASAGGGDGRAAGRRRGETGEQRPLVHVVVAYHRRRPAPAAGRQFVTRAHTARWLMMPTSKRSRASSAASPEVCSKSLTAAQTVSPAW